MHFSELRPVFASLGLQPVMKAGALSFRMSGGLDKSYGSTRDPTINPVTKSAYCSATCG
jgi:hypothetical protein